MGGLRLVSTAAAAALILATPALAANAWGYDVGGVVFSRYQAGFGPSFGTSLAPVGDALGSDTRVLLPGASEVSVRAFVRDPLGDTVPGVALSGVLVLGGAETHVLTFRETRTPEGDHVYDAQRVPYREGGAVADVLFDFDADGQADARWRAEYRGVP